MQDKEFVMSCRQLCVAVSCAIAAFGAKADKVFEGLTEVSDVSVLNNADGNVVLGRGTLKYQESGSAFKMTSTHTFFCFHSFIYLLTYF